MSTKTPIKIHYNGDIRRASLSTTSSFEDFKAVITQLFGAAAALQKVRYVDEDGDRVLVCNAQDIADAFAQAKSQKKTIKFFVDAPEQGELEKKLKAEDNTEAPSAPPAEPVAESTPKETVYITDEPEPTNDGNDDNTNDDDDAAIYPLLNKEARRREKEARRAARQTAKTERRAEQQARKEEQRARKEERQKIQGEQRRAKAAGMPRNEQKQQGETKARPQGGCRWRQQWREHAREFRQKREEERKQFEADIQSFLSDAKVIKALQDTLPALAEALLKGEKLKDVLDNALEAQPALKEHKLTQRLLPLAHQALEMLAPMSQFLTPVLLDVILDLQGLLAKGKLEDMPAHHLLKRICCSAKRAARDSPCFGFGMPMYGPFGGPAAGNCPFPPFWAMGGGRMGGGGGGCPPGFGRYGRF
mmetsp:Transcript_20706/g.41800  ORF Transcript_20706/g.41800 Transcript_20706/m.41800 type:complete len:418 (+) Transcript_20706:108-1361(+)|eukprot:CAMPEP_0167792364 /NCGR_PEP_ID=MMETSP0111_2-20121227/12522_1 /TAXON_ID=91324 /ORGANISM="Lotharella globosa, Strain CCCM811" /LENGTH=417 /DNA_ID=CAMNT_0007685279 /DNA_START=121 /DNA_END=1377 /DNA_ORIENTATION=+